MKDDLTNYERKEWAKSLYIRDDKTIQDTALEAGVDEAELRHWIQHGKWNRIKRSLLISKATQLDRLYDGLGILEKERQEGDGVSTKEIDQAVKYTNAIKNLEAETGLPYIVQVAEIFTTWLRRKDLELTKTVSIFFDEFISEIPAN